MANEVFRQKIEEISDVIPINCNDTNKNFGLLSGVAGFSLFFYILSVSDNNKNYKKKALALLDCAMKYVEQLNNPYHSYCAGLAGLCWLISFFEKQGILQENSISEDVDRYIYILLIKELNNKNIDFLHGASGLSYYFASHLQGKYALKAALAWVKYLEDNLIMDDKSQGIKWISWDLNNNEEYNISLSHGMSAIINVLLLLYTSDLQMIKKRVKPLIEGAMKYVLKQEINVKKYGSFFSYLAIESTEIMKKSRLAWCYGDLGIAVTFYKVGVVLGHQEWIDKSKEILTFAAKNRKSLSENMVNDACICHGSAGIGLIFYRMWWNTRCLLYKEAAEYWFGKTMELSSFEDGIAGFKTYNTFSGSFEKVNNMLEGVAGVGLALTSYYYNQEPFWDKCLLLS